MHGDHDASPDASPRAHSMISGTKPDWRAGLAAVPAGGIAVFHQATGPLAARRVTRALLDEAATQGGGQVFTFPQADLLLGATAGAGQRAAQAMERLTGVAPESFPLPEGRADITARCETADRSPRAPAWSLAALQAHCAAWPLREAARLTILHTGETGAPAAQRLGPAPVCPDDPELEGMAREILCRRLLAALTNPAERGELPALRPGLRLILDVPHAGPQISGVRAGTANGPIALLPLTVLGDQAAFARMDQGLRAGGWAVGLLAGHAAALEWLAVPDVTWAVPATPAPPPVRPPNLIVLGHPAPAWCQAPGILHEAMA